MQNIIVNMKFNADVEQAKKQMQSLQNSLNQVMNLNTNSMGKNASQVLVQDLQKGQQAAAQLQVALRAAFNEKTGKMDLSKFNQSMQQSGMTIQKYKAQLSALGPTGQQAFTKLAQSVASAEIPVLRIGDGMRRLATTFANTARYQLSSSIISGLTQGISQAFRYAKDLNESLNNIRIVTGYSTEQMKEFAKQANKAAKELSTTTTAYTDASLIFYQQGLSGDAVKERADVVVKLANVTGQSAEVVSDQMTAIWNNFDDGSKSMEYYADVITKLGAATASSTDEISDGLEKFAAVSETVGLSYEMATAALATVTAETRQSVDVVGTAFKTIFSRVEGLKLGETLEDGTTLNQYSQALATVGVNIKDQNGQMRKMDDILTDLGAKWQTLGKDQQIALAQSVAGVRQYNQFIALMGNWDKVQENLDVAINSTGELNAQSEIYEESWEAASNRVKASLEGIYDSLINDEFIIKITDFAAKFLSTIENIIDSMGGFKGVVLALGAVLTRVFSTQITASIANLQYSLMGLTKSGRAKLMEIKQSAVAEMASSYTQQSGTQIGGMQTQVGNAQAQGANLLVKAQEELSPEALEALKILKQQADVLAEGAHNAAAIAASQEKIAKNAQAGDLKKSGKHKYGEISEVQGDNIEYTDQGKNKASMRRILGAVKEGEGIEAQMGQNDQGKTTLTMNKKTHAQVVGTLSKNFKTETSRVAAMEAAQNADYGGYIADAGDSSIFGDEGVRQGEAITSLTERFGLFREALGGSKGALKAFGEAGKEAFDEYSEGMDLMGQGQAKLNAATKAKEKAAAVEEKYGKEHKKTIKAQEAATKAQEEAADAQDLITQGQAKAKKGILGFNDALKDSKSKANEAAIDLRTLGKNTEGIKESSDAAGTALINVADKTAQAKAGFNNLGEAYSNIKVQSIGMAQQMTAIASTMMSVGMAFSSLKGLVDTWNNSDMSFGEKMIATMTTLGMVIPMVVSSFNMLNIAKMFGVAVDKEATAAQAAKLILDKIGITTTMAEWAATKIKTAGDKGETAGMWATVAAYIAAQAAAAPVLAITLLIVTAIAALVAIVWLAVKAFEAWKASTPEGKLAAAKEAAAAAGEAFERAKTAAEELKTTIEEYDTAIDKLKGLTKGTLEYEEAVMTANEAAMKLIQSSDALTGKYYIDQEGIIRFNSDALDEAQKEQQKVVKRTMQNYYMNQNAVAQADQAVKTDNLVKKDNLTKTFWEALGVNILTTSTTGGLAFPANVGLAITELNEDILDDQQKEIINAFTEAFSKGDINNSAFVDKETFAESLRQLEGFENASDRLVNSLWENNASLKDLAEEVKSNTQQIALRNQQIVSTEFEDNKYYNNSKNKEALTGLLGSQLTPLTNNQYESIYKDKGKAGGKKDEDIQEEYARLMGYDVELTENKDGNKAVYYYTDESGDQQSVTISDKVARTALAQQAALDDMDKNMQTYAKDIDDIAAFEKEFGEVTTQNFDDYKTKIKSLIKSKGYSDEWAEQYIKEFGVATEITKKVEFENLIQSNKKLSDKAKELILSQDFDENEIQAAIDAAGTATSLTDWALKFEQNKQKFLCDSYESSASTLEDLLSTAAENNQFSASDLQSLIDTDKNFQEYLNSQNIEQNEFLASGYMEQYALLNEYYANLKQNQQDSIELQEKAYQNELEIADKQLEYALREKEIQEETDEATIRKLRDQQNQMKALNPEIEFSGNYEETIAAIETVYDRLEELFNKKIELALDWGGVETLEKSLNEIGNAYNVLVDEAEDLGDSYGYSIEAFKELAKAYPDLGAIAQNTTTDIIKINKNEVDEYTQGVHTKTNETIDYYITKNTAAMKDLESEKERLQTNLTELESFSTGKVKLSSLSASTIRKIQEALTGTLTNYYVDEAEAAEAAQKLIKDDVQGNSLEMASIIGNLWITNSKSVQAYASTVSKATSGNLEDVKDVATNNSFEGQIQSNVHALLNNPANGFLVYKDSTNLGLLSPYNVNYRNILGLDDNKSNIITSNGSDVSWEDLLNTEGFQAEFTEDLNELKNSIKNQISTAEKGIDSYKSSIIYLQGLKNAGISGWGEDDDKNSGSKNNEKELKELEEIIDRYHELERELEQVNRKMEMASSGEKRLDYMRQALELQEKLHAANLVYLESDRLALQELFKNQLKFDADGEIENYSAILDKLNAEKAAITKAYNEGSKDDDSYEKEIESIEKRIEAIETYEETLSQTLDNEVEIWEQHNAIIVETIDQRVEAFEKAVEAYNAQIDWLEYKLEKLEDQAFATAKAFAEIEKQLTVLNGQDNLTIDNFIVARKQWKETLKDSNASEDQKDSAWNAYQSSAEAMISLLETYQSMWDSAEGQFAKHLEDQADAFAEASNELEYYNSLLSSYNDIVELLGRQYVNTGITRDIAKAQVANSKISIQEAVARRNVLKAEVTRLDNEILAAAGDEARKKMLEDQRKEYVEQFREAEEAILETWQAGLEAVATEYETSIQTSIANIQKMLIDSDFYSLEEAKEFYDQQKELSDLRVEEYDKLYQLNKLTRNINKSISELDSVSGNARLSKLLDEINKKKAAGVEMSQDELDTVQKRYDLLMAEIALEEAKDAKDSMRLMRDSQGNWSYVYSANQEAIDTAQQKVDDAKHELEKSSREYIDEMSEAILQNESDMIEALSEINPSDYASKDEYQAAIDRVINFYSEKEQYYYQQIEKSVSDINEAYGEVIISFENLTLAQTKSISSIEQGLSKFTDAAQQLNNETGNAFDNYLEGVDDLTNTAGFNIDNLGSQVSSQITNIGTATQELSKNINALADAVGKDFETALEKLGDFMIYWNANVKPIMDNIEDYIEALYLTDISDRGKVSNFTKGWSENIDYNAKMLNHVLSGKSTSDSDFYGWVVGRRNKIEDEKYSQWGNIGFVDNPTAMALMSAASGNKDIMSWVNKVSKEEVKQSDADKALEALKEFNINFDYTGIMRNYYGAGGSLESDLFKILWNHFLTKLTKPYNGTTYGREFFGIDYNGSDAQKNVLWNMILPGQLKPEGFATGGYTGEWGPEGKLGLLHEKELILNQAQTKDFLSSLELMSRIIDVIDKNTMLAAAGLAIGGASAAAITEKVIQQNVSIEANFPGVTSAIEIEEALNNIINDAVQFASER